MTVQPIAVSCRQVSHKKLMQGKVRLFQAEISQVRMSGIHDNEIHDKAVTGRVEPEAMRSLNLEDALLNVLRVKDDIAS